LTTRAVHIELVEEMSSSSFINALRRITAIRGPIKIFRSERGSNLIGATFFYLDEKSFRGNVLLAMLLRDLSEQ
jgi:hypothetical protein